MLHAAARIAELGAGTLSVICPAELYTAEDCAEWIDQQLAPARIKPRIETAPPGRAVLEARIAELGCGLLALDAAAPAGGRLTLRSPNAWGATWLSRIDYRYAAARRAGQRPRLKQNDVAADRRKSVERNAATLAV